MSGNGATVFSSGLKVLGAQAAVSLVSVGFTIFLARVLTKTEFATFAVYGILTASIDMLVNLGLETMVIQTAPSMLKGHHPEQGMAIMKTTLLSRCIMTVVLGCSVYILSGHISLWLLKTPEYASLIRWMAFGTIFSSVFQCLQLLGQAAQEFGGLSVQTVITNLFQRLLAISLYFAMGLEGYVIGLSLGPLVGIVGMLLVLRDYLFNGVRPAAWGPMVRYSFPYYLRGFGRYGFWQADQIVVGLLLTPEILAAYSIARQFANYLRIGIEAFLTPVMTKVAEMRESDKERLQRAFWKVSRYLSLGVMPVCLTVALISAWLLELYGGNKYRDAWPILVVLSLGQLAYYVSSLYGLYVYALGRPRDLLLLDVFGGVSNLLLSILIVSLIGEAGIAWAQLLAFSLMAIAAKKILSLSMEVHFDTRTFSTLTAPLLLAGGVMVLGLVFYSRLWAVPIYVIVAGAIFVVTLSLCLNDDDWAQIRGVIPAGWSTMVDGAEKLFARYSRRAASVQRAE